MLEILHRMKNSINQEKRGGEGIRKEMKQHSAFESTYFILSYLPLKSRQNQSFFPLGSSQLCPGQGGTWAFWIRGPKL